VLASSWLFLDVYSALAPTNVHKARDSWRGGALGSAGCRALSRGVICKSATRKVLDRSNVCSIEWEALPRWSSESTRR
jgi:hypothetical protein